MAIGTNSKGYREVLGICEGAKEDKARGSAFLKYLKEGALRGRSVADYSLDLASTQMSALLPRTW